MYPKKFLSQDRSSQISNGKFSIFHEEESEEFTDIMSKVPETSSLYAGIKQQLKEAITFGDFDLIDEVRTFVNEHFVAYEFQF